MDPKKHPKVDLEKRKKTNKKFDLPNKCLCGAKIIKIEDEGPGIPKT